MSTAKMFGPYRRIEDAIEAGFGHVLRMGNSNVTEYGFVVALKIEGTNRSYCYTEPKTSGSATHVQVKVELPRGLTGRAFCHNHPANIADPGFGADDGIHYAEAAEKGSVLVWYMMNKFNQILVAQSQADFPAGRPTKLTPKS